MKNYMAELKEENERLTFECLVLNMKLGALSGSLDTTLRSSHERMVFEAVYAARAAMKLKAEAMKRAGGNPEAEANLRTALAPLLQFSWPWRA